MNSATVDQLCPAFRMRAAQLRHVAELVIGEHRGRPGNQLVAIPWTLGGPGRRGSHPSMVPGDRST
jgi:hypothetical protein